MKKIKITLIGLLLCFTYSGFAQENVTDEFTIEAQILELMTITSASGEDVMSFGTIKRTTSDNGMEAADIIINTATTARVTGSGDIRDFNKEDLTTTSESAFAGTSTITGGIGDEAQYARFTITGSENHSYTISLASTSLTLTRENNVTETGTDFATMTVKDFTAHVTGTGLTTATILDFETDLTGLVETLGSQAASFTGKSVVSFGATLKIGADQRAGTYKSDAAGMQVTVDYE